MKKVVTARYALGTPEDAETAAAAANTGKVYTEADPEVSEAVDFTEFYPWTTGLYTGMENIRCGGRGVGLVISPWNFPIAIPTGGMAASLAAGNTVIFKPASAAADAGLKMTVLPAARDAAMPPVGMAMGKFQGEITSPTPLPPHRMFSMPV